MIHAIHPSLSALAGLRRKMEATADNIANINTDGFKKERVSFQEEKHGGVRTVARRINTPGYPKETLQDGKVVEVESSNVDLAEELPEMTTTRYSYGANRKALQVADRMMGSLLDILS